MKKRLRLKNWVVLGIYVLAVSAVFVSFVMVNKILKDSVYSNETLSYVYRGLFDNIIPVVNYSEETFIRPYEGENIEIFKNFYDKDAEASVQENSLIKYQNTYMPNTGVLYKSTEEFDVISALDGTIADIIADEIMGNIVTIKHTNNLTTIYQSLNEVNVLIGDLVKQGDVIGTSGSNKISDEEYMLLFEVISNGEYLNPENFYGMNNLDVESDN